MIKRKGYVPEQAPKLYLVNVRIQSDALKREHLPGEEADLSDWPEAVIKAWVKQGIIAPVAEESEDGA